MHNAMQHATVEEPVQEDQSPLLPPSRSVLLVAFDFDGEEEERRLRKHQSALFFDDEAPPLAGGRPEVKESNPKKDEGFIKSIRNKKMQSKLTTLHS